MYIFSRSLTLLLRATALAMKPFARFSLLTLAIAMPQYAVAQSGSRAATCRNERSASKYQNPYTCPRPWLKNCCASGLFVVTGKLTSPVPPMRYAFCRGPSLNTSPWYECPASTVGSAVLGGSVFSCFSCAKRPTARKSEQSARHETSRKRRDRMASFQGGNQEGGHRNCEAFYDTRGTGPTSIVALARQQSGVHAECVAHPYRYTLNRAASRKSRRTTAIAESRS